MVTLADVLSNAKRLLSAHDVENSDFEAVCMLEKAFGVKYRSTQYEKIKNEQPDESASEVFCEMLRRRTEGEPLQYILGEWQFFGLPFYVGKGVLIPRQDTETLVEVVLEKLGDKKNLAVADLCAGSGCIGITLDKKLSCKSVACLELSKQAFRYLEKNISLNNSAVKAYERDVLSEMVANEFSELDLVVSNPPYLTKGDMENLQQEVSFEPQMALFGGEDGLDFYRDITRVWKYSLKPGGMLAFEIGINQETDVSSILIQHGFENVRFVKDYCGVYRVVYGFKM